MSDIKALAKVRDITGRIIRLGVFESVKDLKVEDDTLVLAVNRAQVRETGGFGFQIKKRGVTLYIFRRDERTGVWSLTDTLPVWWSTDELHGLPAKERDLEWEALHHNRRNN